MGCLPAGSKPADTTIRLRRLVELYLQIPSSDGSTYHTQVELGRMRAHSFHVHRWVPEQRLHLTEIVCNATGEPWLQTASQHSGKTHSVQGLKWRVQRPGLCPGRPVAPASSSDQERDSMNTCRMNEWMNDWEWQWPNPLPLCLIPSPVLISERIFQNNKHFINTSINLKNCYINKQ